MSTLYEKRGRRYVPAREEVALNGFPEGAHLVVVKPGQTTVTYRVHPEHAALLAASGEAFEAMCAAIQREAQSQPSKPLTEEQRKALDEFIACGGLPTFTRQSAASIANAAIRELIRVAANQKALA
jgi:hypothetical protein